MGDWLKRAAVAACGAAVTFVLVVLLNRLLVTIGFSIKKHPEVGNVALTVVALVVGLSGLAIGLLLDWRELAAATCGTLTMTYLVVGIGAAVGAFHNVHINLGRLGGSALSVAAIAAASKSVLELLWRIYRPHRSGEAT